MTYPAYPCKEEDKSPAIGAGPLQDSKNSIIVSPEKFLFSKEIYILHSHLVLTLW